MTPGSSDSLVRRLNLSLPPLGAALVDFPPEAARKRNRFQRIPRELHLSLGASPSPVPNRPYFPKVGKAARDPLLRSLAPSAHSDQSVHSPRVYLTRYVPPSPFLTTWTVYSALTPTWILHQETLMGFLPFKVTPVSRAPAPFPTQRSSHDVAAAALPSTGACA